MTIIIVALIGAGALLLVSAIEGKSIAETFKQIMSGGQLNLSGTKNPGS